MFSHWAYILIGDNDTGKTSFQRYIISKLCNIDYQKLPANKVRNLVHPHATKSLNTIFTCNRSFQENLSEYKNVQYYFKNFFEDADICILSSHASGNCIEQIQQMIEQLSMRCYNIAAVFWSNCYNEKVQTISRLTWQERLWIDNPERKKQEDIDAQLKRIADEFSEMLINRSHTW